MIYYSEWDTSDPDNLTVWHWAVPDGCIQNDSNWLFLYGPSRRDMTKEEFQIALNNALKEKEAA